MIYELVTYSVIYLYQVNCNSVDFLFSLSKIDDRGSGVPGDQSLAIHTTIMCLRYIGGNLVADS